MSKRIVAAVTFACLAASAPADLRLPKAAFGRNQTRVPGVVATIWGQTKTTTATGRHFFQPKLLSAHCNVSTRHSVALDN